MAIDLKRGFVRLCVLASVGWVLGMGAYQYSDADRQASEGLTIEFPKGDSLHFGSEGITQTNKEEMQQKRLMWTFLPAAFLLLLIPASTWLIKGFRKDG